MLNRQKKLIELLKNEGDWVSGQQLSKYLGVSTRTIRSDIASLNQLFDHLILSHNRYGYQLDKTQYYNIAALHNEQHMSPDQRTIYMFQRLFDGQLSVDDIENTLYISHSTIESDILKLKSIIERYDGLKLKRQQGMLSLEGAEFMKRKLFKNLLSSEMSKQFIDKEQLIKLYPDIDMDSIVTVLENILHQENFVIRQDAEVMFYIHVGIIVSRIMSQNYIKTFVPLIDYSSTAYRIAHIFFEKLKKMYAVDIVEKEFISFALLLDGYQVTSKLENNVLLHDNTVISIENLVIMILQHTLQYSGIDFSSDIECVKGLHLHLQGLINRINHDIVLTNPLTKDIKASYPLMFDLSVSVSHILHDVLHKSLSEDEIAFLSLHFGVAYSRLAKKKVFHIVLLGNMNDTLKHLIEEKIDAIFQGKIRIVHYATMWNDTFLSTYDIDFAVTVGSNRYKIPVPSVQITGFMNQQDERSLFNMTQYLEKQQLITSFSMQLDKLMEEQFFHHHVTLTQPDDIIYMMASTLFDADVVNERFYESVIKRETMSSTSFQFGIAIPHAIDDYCKRSIISVTLLDKPVKWGNYDVSMVFMLALRQEDKSFLPIFFEWIGHIIEDDIVFNQLLHTTTRDDFLNVIINRKDREYGRN